MIGQRAVFVAEIARCRSSSPRWAPSRRTSSSARAGRRCSAARMSPPPRSAAASRNSTSDVGFAARPRLRDHLRGLRPDAGQRLPAVGRAVLLPLGVGERLDDVGGVAVGHHPARVLARAVLVVRDLAQRGDRVHGSSVPRRLGPAMRVAAASARPCGPSRARRRRPATAGREQTLDRALIGRIAATWRQARHAAAASSTPRSAARSPALRPSRGRRPRSAPPMPPTSAGKSTPPARVIPFHAAGLAATHRPVRCEVRRVGGAPVRFQIRPRRRAGCRSAAPNPCGPRRRRPDASPPIWATIARTGIQCAHGVGASSWSSLTWFRTSTVRRMQWSYRSWSMTDLGTCVELIETASTAFGK